MHIVSVKECLDFTSLSLQVGAGIVREVEYEKGNTGSNDLALEVLSLGSSLMYNIHGKQTLDIIHVLATSLGLAEISISFLIQDAHGVGTGWQVLVLITVAHLVQVGCDDLGGWNNFASKLSIQVQILELIFASHFELHNDHGFSAHCRLTCCVHLGGRFGGQACLS